MEMSKSIEQNDGSGFVTACAKASLSWPKVRFIEEQGIKYEIRCPAN